MSARKPVLLGAAVATATVVIIAAVAAYQSRSRSLEAERLIARGEELANSYCAACHLATDPSILPKRSWEALLPYMGYWLGMENIDYLADDAEDARINALSRHEVLQRENAMPGQSALSEDDWAAIRTYYVESAPEEALPQPARPELNWQLPMFEVLETRYPASAPVTTLTRIRETTGEIYLGDSVAGTLSVLDGEGRLIVPPMRTSPPVRPIDIEFVGDRVYVGSIGDLLAQQPSEARPALIAAATLVDDSIAGAQFEVVIENLYRMADMNLTDFNGDGVPDIVVSGFGAVFGNVAWYESQPDGSFEEHTLVALPGAVKTESHDFNGDGLLDIMVLLSDAREGLHIFENQGNGQFEQRTIFQTHPAYGHTYFELQDFDDDGDMDVLVVNGDNVDSDPYNTNKYYQGLRIYLNRGNYEFEEAYFYPMYGAFVAKAADFDEDGDLDIAAISFYPDFSSGSRESFTYLENGGGLTFIPFTNGQVMRGRWMTMDIGDVDGDNDVDVVLGAGNLTTGMTTNMDLYREFAREAPPALILKNLLR
ncbi:MAG TPA: FG-GAP-like repeat-containing protein [Gammaproteobacteria bacterium]